MVAPRSCPKALPGRSPAGLMQRSLPWHRAALGVQPLLLGARDSSSLFARFFIMFEYKKVATTEMPREHIVIHVFTASAMR